MVATGGTCLVLEEALRETLVIVDLRNWPRITVQERQPPVLPQNNVVEKDRFPHANK